ncbi:MAG: ATP-binding protein [Bermanella sp.]
MVNPTNATVKDDVLPQSNSSWNWKVLLADDDPLFHKIGHALLDGIEFDGHRIETFTSHDYASTCLFIKENPDTALVVLDVYMDDATTGYKVIEYVRNQLQNNELRILLHTGDTNIESEEIALEKYAISGFLSKLNGDHQQLIIKAKLAIRSYGDIRNIQKLSHKNTELEKEVQVRMRQLLDLSAKLQAEVLSRKQAQENLKEMNNTLELEVEKRTQDAEAEKEKAIKASTAKTEFLSRMSHELRTPLNAILGFSQLLMADKKTQASERQIESVEQITIAGKHLLYLVSEILDLSRIEAGKLKVNIDGLDVVPIINDCVTSMEQTAKGRNIRLTFTEKSDNLWVMADGIRVKQTVLNLISNAIKYGPPDDEVVVNAVANGQYVHVKVRDNGKGVNPAMQEFLFKPFERCKNTELDVEGTGVGLTITKELMELMKGKIDYENQQPLGCEFTLSYPKVKD